MERFIFNQLIVDAGKDNSNRPILAVYCCHLPDPEITDYDALLDLCFKRLNRIVASEYILVVFTSPIENSPTFAWMRKAYNLLRRDYKKNIKQLIIVHPSWWFKFLMWIMRTIVSSKFAKKVINVDSIDQLDLIIDTSEMNIPGDIREFDREEAKTPEAVLNEADIIRARQIMTGSSRPRVFGLSLEQSMAPPPGVDPAAMAPYPEEVKNLIQYVMDKGLRAEGVFRRSPNAVALAQLRKAIDARREVSYDEYDVYTLVCALKAFIRELPTPLIPRSTYAHLASAATVDPQELPGFVARNFVQPLDERSKCLLQDVMLLSASASQLSSVNRMTSKAIAIVWVPTMIRHGSPEEDFQSFNASEIVIEAMISRYADIFVHKESTW